MGQPLVVPAERVHPDTASAATRERQRHGRGDRTATTQPTNAAHGIERIEDHGDTAVRSYSSAAARITRTMSAVSTASMSL